jgi:hypothetical protein
MAETTTSPTNKLVSFRGKAKVERPRAADKPKRLPAKVKRVVKVHRARGLVSDAAIRKHMGEV